MLSAGELSCVHPSMKDLPAIVNLDQRCLGGFWSESGYRREMESPNSILRVLSTLKSSEVAQLSTPSIIGMGCVWAILDEAHITLLGIDPQYQGQGLGQWLLLHLLIDAQERQLHHATLEVRVSNTSAQKLYQKFEFQSVGCRRRYYSDGEDALLLWLSGLQSPQFSQKLAQWRSGILKHLDHQGWCITDEKLAENRIVRDSSIFDKN